MADNDSSQTDGPARLMSQLLARPGDKGPAPVEDWNPPDCGEMDMRIARDGTWYYMGSPIARPAMVQLFASVLRRDADGCFYLVTPVEKIRLTVEDAPFIAVSVDVAGQGDSQVLTFETNMGDRVEAGPDHRLRVETDPATAAPSPYLHIRGRLEALISRSVFYELVALGEPRDLDGQSVCVVTSRGAVFSLGALE